MAVGADGPTGNTALPPPTGCNVSDLGRAAPDGNPGSFPFLESPARLASEALRLSVGDKGAKSQAPDMRFWPLNRRIWGVP